MQQLIQPLISFHSDVDVSDVTMEKINKKRVDLANGQWTEQKIQTFCQYFKKWELIEFWLHENKNSIIIREISNIHFPQLKYVNFSMNKIESIELLNRIDMPLVEKVILNNNKIQSIKQLRKLRSLYLRLLDFNMNLILEGFWLTQHPSPNLKMITFELQKTSNVQEQNFNFLSKIKPKGVTWMYFFSQKRVKQLKLREKFKQIMLKGYVAIVQ